MQAQVKDICRLLETHYPLHIAEKWDNVGLQLGSYLNPVRRVVISLDLNQEVLDQAIDQEADLIITHHPFFFNPIKNINCDTTQGKLISQLIKHDISLYAAHTNLDSASQGLNQYLAEKLNLKNIQLLTQTYSEPLYKLVVYVPGQDEAAVRNALSSAGAGHLGSYSHCTFRSKGIGTFLPQPGSQPYIGKQGVLEEVEEIRLETIVPQNLLTEVLVQMQTAHPYEEPAYDVYLLYNQGEYYSPGRIGHLATAVSLLEFCEHVKTVLQLDSLRVVGNYSDKVQKIAVVSGAGTSFIPAARAAHCDLLLTGDLKYHEARDAEACGLAIVDAGHQGTEQVMPGMVADLLQDSSRRAGFELDIVPVMVSTCIKSI